MRRNMFAGAVLGMASSMLLGAPGNAADFSATIG
jgi:hypothetical protein